MTVAEMVLAGGVNKQLVGMINALGGSAVGLCGKDGNLVTAEIRDPELGRVGDITAVDVRVLKTLTDQGYIPVISSIGSDKLGGSYNINADTLAGSLAGALKAEKLMLLTDIAGVMADPADPKSLFNELTEAQIDDLIADGTVSGGMVPKMRSCLEALHDGVTAVHVLDGRKPHSLLLEIFTTEGSGTMISNTAHKAL